MNIKNKNQLNCSQNLSKIGREYIRTENPSHKIA